MSNIIHVVSIPGFEGDIEPVAAFSDFIKAKRFVRKYEFTTRSIESLEIDSDPNESEE